MKIGRMTWAGFGLVLIGWVLLVTDLAAGGTLAQAGSLASTLTLRADITTLAQTIVGTGFGLAIVGTLRAGFGAWTRFFDAVLQRSVTPRSRNPVALDPEPIVTASAPTADAFAVPFPEPAVEAPPAIQPFERPTPARPVMPEGVKADGSKQTRAKPRNYIILADGSVEVETMFGTRVFATMDEARDFIR